MRSMGSDFSASVAVSSSDPNNSASSPRPSPLSLAIGDTYCTCECRRARRFFAAEHLAGQREIRLRAFRGLVDVQRRNAVARRLGEADLARDHCTVEFVTEVLLQIGRHVERKRVAWIVHCPQQSLDLKLLIQMRAYAADGLHQVGQALERVILALHR